MKVYLLILMTLFLCACGNLIPPIFNITQTPSSTPPYVPPNPQAPQTPTISSSGTGVIKCRYSSQVDSFNKRLKAFLSTTINPNQIGWHSCTKDSPGGVFFKGQVKTNNPILPNGDNQGLIVDAENSFLNLYFETSTPNKSNVAPIALSYTYGSIQGKQALLTFEDHKGDVHLDGQFVNRNDGKFLFTGVFRFVNHQTWDGKVGYKGELGDFAIEACKFFQC